MVESDVCCSDFLNQKRFSPIGFITFSEPMEKDSRKPNERATQEVIAHRRLQEAKEPALALALPDRFGRKCTR